MAYYPDNDDNIVPKSEIGSLEGQPSFWQHVDASAANSNPIPKSKYSVRWMFIIGASTLTLFLLIFLASWLVFKVHNKAPTNNVATSGTSGDNYKAMSIPLSSLAQTGQLQLGPSDQLVINGQLKLNNEVVLTPTTTPQSAVAGEFYYNQTSNQPYYYNGSQYISLASGQSVSSIGGLRGVVSLGNGLQASNGQLSLSKSANSVTSLQGQTGGVQLVSGTGINLNGTTINNSGVTGINGATGSISLGRGLSISNNSITNTTNITSSSSNLTVTTDGNGNFQLSLAGVGSSGTLALGPAVAQVDSSTNPSVYVNKTANGNLLDFQFNGTDQFVVSKTGQITSGSIDYSQILNAPSYVSGSGAVDTVALFNGNQSITNSIISQNNAATTVTVAGALNVTNGISGNGSGLTSLNATNIASGTLADNRLTSDVTLQGNVFNGASELLQLNGSGDLPAVNAINLTNLNVSNATAGTLNNARLSNSVTLQGNVFNGANQLLELTNVGYLPVINASNITNINASNISSGTVSDLRLSSNVPLINANNTFTGNDSFSSPITTNSIQPSTGLTIGSTADSLNLQGNASTQISSTSGANVTTVGFSGSPTGNVNYYFDTTAPAGSYTICSTIGNCAGVAGGVVSSVGTVNDIPKFSAAHSLTNSNLSDDGTTLTVSEDGLYQSGSNSTTAFQIQNAGGTSNLFVADTTNSRIAIGQPSANYTLDVNGDINSATGLRVDGNLVCTSSGCDNNSGSGYYIQNGVGVQTSANFNIESNLGNDVVGVLRGNSGGQTADLLQAQDSGGTAVAEITSAGDINIASGDQYEINGSQISSANLSNSSNIALLNGTGPQTFTGNNKFVGNTLVQPASDSTSAFQIQNAAGTSNLFVADTTDSRIGIGTSTPGYTLDVNGDVNISSGSEYLINGVPICGPSSTCAPSAGSNFYIQNSTSLQTATNFNIQSANASSVGGIIQGAGGQTADLFDAITGAGSTVFDVNASGDLAIGKATSSYPLDVVGDINSSTGIRVAGNLLCTSAGCLAPTGTYVSLQGTTPGVAQVGNININGTDIATNFSGNGSQLTSLNGANLQGGTVANTALVNSSVTISNGTNITGGGSLALGGSLTVGTVNNPNFSTSVTTPSILSTAALSVTGGTSLTLKSTGSNAANFDSGTNGAVNIGTGSNAKTVTVGSIVSGSATVSQAYNISNTLNDGSDTIQSNDNDSTSTFQVENAAGADLIQVDTANNNINIGGNNSGELQPWLTNSNSLPTTLVGHATVEANGYVYAFGGYNGVSVINTVYYAQLNANGSTGAWVTSTNPLPQALIVESAIVANGYIYIIGGANSSVVVQSTVYYAQLNANGTTGAWRTSSNALPQLLEDASTVSANGYIYEIGGFNGTSQDTVYYAQLNANGTTGAWVTSSNPLPTALTNASAVVANGYVYVAGGVDGAYAQSTVYYAQLNANGSTGAWVTSSNPLPSNLYLQSSIVANGYIYEIGGISGGVSQDAVYYAQLNPDGSTGAWISEVNSLPNPLSYQTSVIYDGYVYAIGGFNGSVDESSVYYASTQRIEIGGSLDLLSLSGGNLGGSTSGTEGQGSSGGQLTAGDTDIVGDLQVAGEATFANGVSIEGNLNSSSVSANDIDVAGNIPTEAIGSVSTNGTSANSIYTQGPYTYVVEGGPDTWQIIDSSNPSNPVVLSTVSTGTTTPSGIYVQGEYAYVTGDQNGLSIYNISDPTNPTLISANELGGNYDNIYVQGNYAYVLNYSSSTLSVINVSNAYAPTLVKTISTGTNPSNLFIQGNYAYVVNAYPNTLESINISNPNNPVVKDTVSTGQEPRGIYVQGNYVYVAVNGNTDVGVDIFNIDDPTNMIETSSWAATPASDTTGIYVQGRYAYIVNYSSDTLQTLDVSNPANPVLVGTVSTGNTPWNLTVVGHYAYVVNEGSNNLQVFDLGGEYAQQLQAGGIETGTLQVDSNSTIQGDESIAGGLSVSGPSEIGGSLAVDGTTQLSGSAILSGGIQGGFSDSGLATPSAPVVSFAGNTGTTATWSYEIVAVGAGGGTTIASSVGSITTSDNSTLSVVNYNQISWVAVPGATSYEVFRTAVGTSPSTTGLIGTTSATSLNDTGLAGDGSSPPTVNTSGSVSIAGPVLFKGTSSTTTSFEVENAAGTANLLNVDSSNQIISLGNLSDYSTGTVSQHGTTITGVGTSWTNSVVGQFIIFGSGQTETITGYTSGTILIGSVSETIASTSYVIEEPVAQISMSGVEVGNTTNGINLSATGGITATGTARTSKEIVLTPEYAGAVLDNGSSDPGYSSDIGTMNSGFDSTQLEGYYQWSTSQSSAQSYDVVVSIPMPSDFSSFNTTSPLSIDIKGTSGSSINAWIWDAGNTTSDSTFGSYSGSGCNTTAGTSWSNWSTCSISNVNPGITANGTITLRIRLTSPSGGSIQLGNIYLKYLSNQ